MDLDEIWYLKLDFINLHTQKKSHRTWEQGIV